MSKEIQKQELGPKQKAWVAALRSGKYEQGIGNLHSPKQGGGDTFCCLGVACEVANVPHSDQPYRAYGDECATSFMPQEAVLEYAMRSSAGRWNRDKKVTLAGVYSLTGANDARLPFTKIAEFIEEHPELIFKEPR